MSLTTTWYPVVNDEIGGWAVANVNKPSSRLDYSAGDREIGCFMDEETARHVAAIHNESLKQRAVNAPVV